VARQGTGWNFETFHALVTFKCEGCGVRKKAADCFIDPEQYWREDAYAVCSHRCLERLKVLVLRQEDNARLHRLVCTREPEDCWRCQEYNGARRLTLELCDV
jgi:hypothetical protein